MREILLEVDLFGDPATRALSEQALQHALDALTVADQLYLRKHRDAPHPYKSGVVFTPEPVGIEKWQSYGRMLQTRQADCEDIAAALAAWIREREGRPARAQIIGRKQRGRVMVYHIGVSTGGRLLDPSRVLGMGAVA